MDRITQNEVELTEDDILAAIQGWSFVAVYEPQISFKNNGRLSTLEAKFRLNHPEYGLMPIAECWPMIEALSLQKNVVQHFLRIVAIDWLAINESNLSTPIVFSVDASILSLPECVSELVSLYSEMELPEQKIGLMVSGVRKDMPGRDVIMSHMTTLKVAGFSVGFIIDDDSRVPTTEDITIPVDTLQITDSIIANLMSRESAKTCVLQTLDLADHIGAHVSASGVSDEGSSHWLERKGCDLGCGSFYSRPVRLAQIVSTYANESCSGKNGSERLSVLVVDDDTQYQSLLLESLSDTFDTYVAGNISSAKAKLGEKNIDIIVCDVFLPDGSGIDFCREESTNTEFKDKSVLFISGNGDIDNKIDAYEAGGVDFIQKPFSIVELNEKIKRIAAYQKRRYELVSDVESMRELSTQTMKDASYYGEILQFFKKLFLCSDEEQIGTAFFIFLRSKGLNSSVQFRGLHSSVSLDQDNGVCSPIEINIFELLRNKGRLYSFGRRSIVNDTHVSFIIKNMPTDECELGRLRDYIAIIIEAMEARYREILRQRVLNTVMEKLEDLASKLISVVGADQDAQKKVVEKYSFELQMSFHTLDLSEEQEQHITRIINDMVKTRESSEETTLKISKEAENLLSNMTKYLGDLESQDSQSKADDIAEDSIELF